MGAPALGLVGAALPVPKRKYSVSYSGQIRGLAVIGEVKNERDGASLLGSTGEKKAFMLFGEDGSEITVIEAADSKEPTVYLLKPIHVLNAK